MPTLVWIEGFEHKVYSQSGWIYTPNVWDTINTGGSIVVDLGRTAGFGALFTVSSGTTAYLRKNRLYNAGASSIFTGTTLVGSAYFYPYGTPSGGEITTFAVTTAGGVVRWKLTTAPALRLYDGSTGRSTSATLTTSAWHRLDFKIDISGGSVQWAVDGTEVAAADTVATGASFTDITFGCDTASGASAAVSFTWDDAVFSTTSGDYPLGEYKVLRLLPNGDGTHSNPTGGLAKSTGGTTNVWDVIDELPPTITDYLLQANTAALDYLEWTYEDSAESSVVAGRTIYCTASAGTASNNASVTTYLGAASLNPHSGDFSATTAQYNAVMLAGWTPSISNLNSLVGRFGFSSDAAPDPWLGGAMIEYAVPVSAITTKSPPFFNNDYRRSTLLRM